MVSAEWIHAGTLEELKTQRSKIVKGGIAVFYHEDKVAAVDNRCPHLGFPLHLGSVCDGILTCHWHHARFDVCSGGTLDPWADDVPAYDVKIEGEEVWVNAKPRYPDNAEKLKARLREGLEQNIGIVIAKAVVGLVESGASSDEMVRIGIEFGTSQGNGWGAGLTILTAMRNVLPKLDKTGQILALFHGLAHVAQASAGRPPRHLLRPLPSANVQTERLIQWYRNCVEVRDTQGAEKVLLTAVSNGVTPERLADMMLMSVTDHFYLDGGHTFDFHNKAFEALDHLGADAAEQILASLVPLMGDPTRSEELHHWQAPIDLVKPVQQAFEQLKNADISTQDIQLDEAAFVEQILSDRPLETVERITKLLLDGMQPARLAQLITLAAAERILRFHTQNDFGDWVAVLHTFTYAHAVHKRLSHSKEPMLNRALFYGAIAVYHDRFLNVPRAPKPKITNNGAAESYRPEDLLELMDRRQQVDEAARWVAGYLGAGNDAEVLLNTLGHSLLREDAEFHSFQLYEASVSEYELWQMRSDPFAQHAKESILLACTRYLAAHAPTAREMPHTARIAWRLYSGERLFEEE